MYPEWYFHKDVKFNLIRFTNDRQFYLGVPKYLKQGQKLSKWYRCFNVQSLDYVFANENIKENKFNCFVSLAKYYEVPYRIRNKDFPDDKLSIYGWNSREDNYKYVKEFDFFIDIDADSHDDIDFAYYSTKEICNFLDNVPVTYCIRFSGRGFHILIPESCFNFKKVYDYKSSNSIYKVYAQLAKYLYDMYSELIDTKIYVSRCKIKLPLSISLYEDDEYICLPLSRNDFDNFKLEKMKPELHLDSLNSYKDYYRNHVHSSGLRLLKKCGVNADG